MQIFYHRVTFRFVFPIFINDASTSKARKQLYWSDKLNFEESIRWTIDWHKNVYDGLDSVKEILKNIWEFESRWSGLGRVQTKGLKVKKSINNGQIGLELNSFV